MKLEIYERLVLGACLMDYGAARIVAPELPDTAFAFGPDDGVPSSAHGLIYRAIQGANVDGEVTDVACIAGRLGDSLTAVGGTAYLTRLTQTLGDLGITSTAGLPKWMQVVDKAGRIRALADTMANAHEQIVNVEHAIQTIEDVDEFLADTLHKLGRANTVKQSYEPISMAVAKAKLRLENEAAGQIVSWLPIGWPSLDPYRLLPYESLMVIMGISSMGKSQMVAQFLLGAAIQLRRNNIPGICTLHTYEMGAAQYTLRMGACLAQVDLLKPAVRDTTSAEYLRLNQALEFIATLPIHVDTGMTSAQMYNHSRLMQAQHGRIHVIAVDYSELVPDRAGAGGSEEQRVTGIFRASQQLSRAHATGACVIVVSQFPNDIMHDDTKLGVHLSPRYSGAGTHAAEVKAIVYNPIHMTRIGMPFKLPMGMDAAHAYFVVAKNKEGPTGVAPLTWKAEHTRFADPLLIGFGKEELFAGYAEVIENLRHGEGDF